MPTITRFPAVYCANKDLRPVWLPPSAPAFKVREGFGCDAFERDGRKEGGGGWCFGDEWQEGGWKPYGTDRWIRFAEGHCPQHLMRAERHPRVLRHRLVPGVQENHSWIVPVLVQRQHTQTAVLWRSALDRILADQGWSDPEDLAGLVESLIAAASSPTFHLHADHEANEAALIALAVRILQITHHLDRDLLVAAGWLSESLLASVLMAAVDHGGEAVT